MTTVEAATSANHEQATNLAAAEGIPAAANAEAAVAEARAEPVAPLAQPTPERADVSAVAAVEVPAELAAAVEAPVKPAPKKAAVVADEEEEEGEAAAEEGPADLALADADIFEAIAAADGARAMPGAGGQASLLSNEGGGIGIVPILAVAAAAGGAIVLLSDGDSEQGNAPPPPPPANRAPTITSGGTATVAENIATTATVYDANATDADGDTITFSLTGADAAAFNINAQTGVVTFKASPDFETKAAYDFNVVANDGKGGSATQAVKVTVTDVVEGPPPGTTVNLDTADSDNNVLTVEVVEGAANGNVTFADSATVASNSIISDFTQGDLIRITANAADVNFTTAAGDVNDLEITFNVNGVVSRIILDEVLDGTGFITNEASAIAEVGFDFIEIVAPTVAATDQSFA
jgi:hypothetical protein